MSTETLRYILGFVDGHVRFAEAKNAAAFAAAGGTALAAGSLLLSEPAASPIIVGYLAIVTILSLAGAVVCVVSFLPRTQLPWLGQLDKPEETDNLLFFGHIQKYEAAAYWKRLVKGEAEAIPPLDFHMSEQIVINSRLAARKFTLFKYAAWLLLSAYITPLGAALVFWYIRDPND